MAKKFGTPIDLQQNELRRTVVEVRATTPSSPVEGQIWYASGLGRIVYQGPSGVINPTDRATHTGTQLAATISDFDAQVRTSRLDQMSAPTAAVSFNSQRITNLADPVNPQDAASKAYVDAASQGLDIKASVRVATTGNVTLSGEQTIDGVAVTTGQRVLVKDQTTASENGIYVAAAGAWSRAADADTSAEVNAGMFTFVEEGTTNGDTGWVLTTNNPITLGTTGLAFAQFSGAGSVVAGAGLTKTGNTLDVGAGTGISVSADSVAIDTAVVARKYAQAFGDGSATAYVITHNLGTRDVAVSVYENASPWAEIECDVEKTSANTITLRFSVAPTTDQYRVAVIG